MKKLPGGINIYECSDWGARPPLNAFNATTPSDMVLHHMTAPTAAFGCTPRSRCCVSWDSAMIKGYRDTGCVTDCPGGRFESRIPRFRTKVHNQIAALQNA